MFCHATTRMRRSHEAFDEVQKKLEVDCRLLLEIDFDTILRNIFPTEFPENNSRHELAQKISLYIDSCHARLHEGYSAFSDSQKDLTPYYQVARTILRGAKTSLLKLKLSEENLDPFAFKDLLERLNQIVADIFIAYENMDFAHQPPPILKSDHFLCESFPVIHRLEPSKMICRLVEDRLSPLSMPSPVEFDHCFAVHKLDIEKKRARHFFKDGWLVHYSNNIREISPENDPENWARRLEEAILKIPDLKDLCIISKTFTTTQVLKIVSMAEQNCALESKLLHILTSLDYNVLEEVLEAFANQDLTHLNLCLRKIVAEYPERKDWAEHQFFTIRQTFVKTRNSLSDTIDTLSERFRKYLYPHQIVDEDLEDIEKLIKYIAIRKNNIRTLLTIYQGVISHPETIKVLNELIEAHNRDLTRLSNDPNDQSLGRIFDIIHRNVFTAANCEDEDPVYECFALFSLVSAVALRDCGLLSALPQEQFEEQKEKLTALNRVAFERLKSAGIQTIGDLKRLKIYNATFLRHYLKENEGE